MRTDPTMTDLAPSRLRRVTAIEVACGAGAIDDGCRDGPAGFLRDGAPLLHQQGIVLAWQPMPDGLCDVGGAALDAVARTGRWLAATTRHLAASGETFVVIGGDHSASIGTWSGVTDALRPSGPVGLIWIDAHMDMHRPETTHSGALHGMPVAALMGHGADALTSIAESGAAVDPRHVCLLGTRSFEPEEVDLATRLGVRVIDTGEIRRRGIGQAFAEAQSIASSGTVGYGVSLDLDVFDPADAPGVGTPVPEGIRAGGFLDPWRLLTRDPKCLGIEIVEYNPWRDQATRTARLMSDLIAVWGSEP